MESLAIKNNTSSIAPKWSRSKTRKHWHYFFMALPLMVIVLMLTYIPLFGWILSLMEYHAGTPILKNKYVGLKYFWLIFNDRSMLRVMKNTLIFAFAGFLLAPLPMIFAILLNEIGLKRFKKFSQTITTLPHFISWIVVFSFAYSIFARDGLLNDVLVRFGLIKDLTNILGDQNAVYWFQIALQRWKELGWSAIIFIAALTGIDQELYEAAFVDGAGRVQLAWHITIPGLMPTFIVLLLLQIANFVNVGFEQYFVFKNALVYDNIETIDLFAYRLGLQQFDYSYATAVGILKSVISLTLLFSVNALAKRVRGRSII
jgi:putative aldouronate transport system permease protein